VPSARDSHIGMVTLVARHQSNPISPGPPPASSLPPPQPQSLPTSGRYGSGDLVFPSGSEDLPLQPAPRITQTGDSVAGPSRPSNAGRRPQNPPPLQLPPNPVLSRSSIVPSSRPSTISTLPSPRSPPRTTPRPSSRRALIAALQLAQEAVQLDSDGDDPHAAVAAYSRSVSLLNEVMERVMVGEGSEGSGRPSRTLTAREEEVRRLKSIVRDTYHLGALLWLSYRYLIPL
jgi:hypothetical protein